MAQPLTVRVAAARLERVLLISLGRPVPPEVEELANTNPREGTPNE